MSSTQRLGLRLVGLAVGIALGWQVGALLSAGETGSDARALAALMTVVVGAIGYVIGPHLSAKLFRDLREHIRNVSTLDLVAAGAGLAFGGVVSALFAIPLGQLPTPFGEVLPFVLAVLACGLTVSIALLRKRDLFGPWVTRDGRRPGRPAADGVPPPTERAAPRTAALLDTSVIIDGRLPDLIRTGFLPDRLLLPRFVLDELQAIADASDPLRRARGRRGLDALNRLRGERPDGVEVVDPAPGVAEPREVDARLVRLARERGVALLTNDYNLDRVAKIQGVRVLNLNDLAAALRPQVLPGEELTLKVVQEGREAGQGIGFLDDGTMVVVDGGRPLVGQQTAVVVTRLLPTGAGRLVFAVPKSPAASRAS